MDDLEEYTLHRIFNYYSYVPINYIHFSISIPKSFDVIIF